MFALRPKVGGFTLIELMVVITIIAILTAVGYSIYSNAQKSSLDSRRKSDIDAIAKAYESNYNAKINKYTSLQATDFVNGKLPAPPEDPNEFYPGFNGGFPAPATGQTTSQASSFLVCAKLSNAPATSGACSPSLDYCYCKSSSQGAPVASETTAATAPEGLAGSAPPPPTSNCYTITDGAAAGSTADNNAWVSWWDSLPSTASKITISANAGVKFRETTAATNAQSILNKMKSRTGFSNVVDGSNTWHGAYANSTTSCGNSFSFGTGTAACSCSSDILIIPAYSAKVLCTGSCGATCTGQTQVCVTP